MTTDSPDYPHVSPAMTSDSPDYPGYLQWPSQSLACVKGWAGIKVV